MLLLSINVNANTKSMTSSDLNTLVKVAWQECSICSDSEIKAVVDATYNFSSRLKKHKRINLSVTKKAFPWYRGSLKTPKSKGVDKFRDIVYNMNWVGVSNGANHFHLKRIKTKSLRNMKVTLTARYHVFKKERIS